MKSIIAVLLIAGLSLLAACSRQQPAPQTASTADSTSHAAAQEYWTCTMHPYVHEDKPGLCPVCGMPLVKKSAASSADAGTLKNIDAVRFSPSQRALANVQTTLVERRAFHPQLNAVGVIDIVESKRAVVSARYRGRIEALHANTTGMRIRKGESLMEIYSPEIVAAAQEYLIAFDGREMSDPGRQLYESLKSKLQSHYGLTDRQLGTLESTHVAPARLSIAAPLGGTLLRKDVVEGMYVSEGTSLMEIADLSTVWAWFDLYESDVPRVHLGDRADITADGAPGTAIIGRVSFIDPVLNPATRTARVRVDVANTGGQLRPQMFVRAQFSSGARKALVVPVSAVMQTGPRTVVWVESSENVFEPRDVALGGRDGDMVEILSGVHEGESVATAGAFLIDSESQLSHPAAHASQHEGGHHD